MPVLRSLLFVPGNRANMLQKATGSNPDAFIPDLEDSVPTDEKTEARNVTASHLEELAQAGRRVIPRVNSLDTGLLEEDLAAVVGPHVYGVSVGKISTPADVAAVEGVLENLEANTGLPRGHVKLVPWIETALAIVKAYEICTSSPRIVGVAFGAEDLTHDMGIERREDDGEVAHARNVMCVAARAAGVLALDTPYFGFRDPEGLKRNAQASRGIGFKGKFAIHPAQVDLINAAFSPSDAEVAHARRVVEAFEDAERRGRGSTSLDGRVVDVPVVKRARDLLELAASLQ
ncbi:MAG: CoA ester lyase [Candidatus Tectomicrobia bacterium]|nr:CoA ester lyase [Candidatus Tectomicrobia bacterium]